MREMHDEEVAPPPDEDPAGGVTIPMSRREIARAHALAGIVLGMSAVFGVLATDDTSSLTRIN